MCTHLGVEGASREHADGLRFPHLAGRPGVDGRLPVRLPNEGGKRIAANLVGAVRNGARGEASRQSAALIGAANKPSCSAAGRGRWVSPVQLYAQRRGTVEVCWVGAVPIAARRQAGQNNGWAVAGTAPGQAPLDCALGGAGGSLGQESARVLCKIHEFDLHCAPQWHGKAVRGREGLQI